MQIEIVVDGEVQERNVHNTPLGERTKNSADLKRAWKQTREEGQPLKAWARAVVSEPAREAVREWFDSKAGRRDTAAKPRERAPKKLEAKPIKAPKKKAA